MRELRKVVTAAVVLGLLTGCATVTEKYEAQRRDEAKTFAEKGNFQGAYQRIRSDLSGYGPAANKAAELISSNPQFKSNLPNVIRADMRDAYDPDHFRQAASILDYASLSSVLSEDSVTDLRKYADDLAGEGNRSNRLQWLLTDRTEHIASLRAPDQQRLIYNRSVALLRKQPPVGARLRPSNLAQSVFDRAQTAGPQSEEYKTLQAELPNLALSTQELRTTVAQIFPQYAAKEVASREVVVKVNFDDRLIEEDAMAKLRQLSPNLTFIKDGPAAVSVSVKKLQWDEKTAPQQTQTVTYSQSDVNMLAAALLMPRNASYIYEVSSGGVQLAYAFEVKATSKGEAPFDELVRDRASREWRSCSNERIQNVFGGVQRADFVANDHMRSVCGAGSSPASPDMLRNEAIDRLVTVIGRIPAIAKVASRGDGSAVGSAPVGKVSYASSTPFSTGDRVKHAGFGTGTVRSLNGTDALVLFDGREKPTPVGMEVLTKI